MSLRHRLEAHADRCRTICAALAATPCSGGDFTALVFRLFPADGPPSVAEEHRRRRLYLLTLAFFGRLPREHELPAWAAAGRQPDPDRVAEELQQSNEFRTGPHGLRRLVGCDPQRLVVDVTHTLRYHSNSGIQRVVRSLAARLRSDGHPHLFIRYCKEADAYLPLEPTTAAALLDPPPRPSRLRRLLARANRLARTTGRRAAAWMGTEAVSFSAETPLLLWNQPLLLPELVTERERVDALCTVLASTPLHATLIFYDAIPLKHPEYFDRGVLSGYLSYLRLLQHVDSVSCISRDVAGDLAHILGVVHRHRPPPAVAVHYLGADFHSPPRHEDAATGSALPRVLCVGTIEPRKNQLRILEAMVQAQAHGCRFLGTFVGNAGWLNGGFRDALRRRIEEGYALELHENVSDATLASLYERSAFTVYCSVAEGFGLPIIESVMRRRVCVTSRRGSMQEVASQLGGCVLVEPEDIDDIASAIRRLVEEPAVLAVHQCEADAATWPDWSAYASTIHRFCSTRRRSEAVTVAA